MRKAFKQSIFASALALSMVMTPAVSFAQGYDELINSTNVELEGLSQEQTALYQELSLAYAEIEAFNAEANTLVAEVANDDKAIAELAQEVDALQQIINKRETLLAEQARSVQETGGSSNYLNYIASSKDISDFVGRVDVVRKMVSANKDLLDQQIQDKENVESKKSAAQASKQEKIRKMAELERLKETVSESVAQKEEIYSKLTNDISIAQSQREALVEEKSAFEESQRLAAEQAAQTAAQAHQQAVEIAQAVDSNEVYQVMEVEETTVQTPVTETTMVEESSLASSEEIVETTEVLSFVEETTTETTVAQTSSAPSTEALALTETTTVTETTQEPTTVAQTTVEATTEAQAIEGPAGTITYQEPNAQEIAESERQAQADREAAEKAEAERIAAEEAAKAEAERIAAEEAAKAEAERIATEQAAAPAAPSGNLLGNAAKYIGTPYVWGGKSPGGFDCSGFVQYVFRETYGVDIGGWTGAQENAGTRISVAEAQPGDLYFWGSPGGTYHVAIATGGGQYIHASQPGTPLGYSSTQWFTPDFAVRVN